MDENVFSGGGGIAIIKKIYILDKNIAKASIRTENTPNTDIGWTRQV